MKKSVITSLILVNWLYCSADIVDSIPLSNHDLEVLSKTKSDRVETQVVENVANEYNEDRTIEGEFVDEQPPSYRSSHWVDNMANNGTVINIKSYLKGLLNGLKYSGEGIDRLKSKSDLMRFYNSMDYSTFWISPNYTITPNIFSMMQAIKEAPNQGLDRDKYHYEELSSLFEVIKNSKNIDENSRNLNIAKLDIYLTDAFLTMAKDLYEGEVDMHRFLKILKEKELEEDIHYSWDLPLRSKNYVQFLKSMKDSSNFLSNLFGLSNSNNMINSLKTAYARYNAIKNHGGWPVIPRGARLGVGSVDKVRVPLLAKRLYMSGDFNEPSYAGAKMTKELSEALKHFQRRVGRWDSGRLDEKTRRSLNVPVEDRLKSIALNISRLRSDRENFGDEYIVVNIPDFRMSFVKDNQDVLGMRVVVGRRKNPTPIFSSYMKYFEINPYWTVPDSIVKKEMLHRIQEDPDYLSSRRFKMYKTWKSGAKSVDAFDIDWWKYSDDSDLPFRFVKEPGKGNPLGFVKFMFPNSHAVYMHDTDERRLFKSPVRAYSHGCIRLQRPQDLLDFISQNYTSVSPELIDEARASKKNQSFKLNKNIPVHIRYWTAWVNDDGGVSFRNDIYGYDRIQKRLMNR